MSRHCRSLGYEADIDRWRDKGWFRRLAASVAELSAVLPKDCPFILIDDQTWGAKVIAGHPCIPFLECDGEYGGSPDDDAIAIRELERLRNRGVNFLAVAWPSFWWPDEYPKFFEYLRTNYLLLIENDRLLMFDLSS
jgi:hypothetical protein